MQDPIGDHLRGGRGADLIIGGDGNDHIRGGRGGDVLIGGNGDDRVRGGRGADVIDGGNGDDRLRGGPGADVIDGGNGDDGIRGGRGRDVLAGGRGADHLRGFRGADVLAGDRGADRLSGGRGGDVLLGQAGRDAIHGGRGNDVLRGGRGSDVLRGGRDHDVLAGDQGADELAGARGRDVLIGGAGRDDLFGGRGSDVLADGRGADLLRGGKGNDVFQVGAGDNVVRGGAGGRDVVSLGGDRSDYRVRRQEDGSFVVRDKSTGERNVVRGVEVFSFADQTTGRPDLPSVSREDYRRFGGEGDVRTGIAQELGTLDRQLDERGYLTEGEREHRTELQNQAARLQDGYAVAGRPATEFRRDLRNGIRDERELVEQIDRAAMGLPVQEGGAGPFRSPIFEGEGGSDLDPGASLTGESALAGALPSERTPGTALGVFGQAIEYLDRTSPHPEDPNRNVDLAADIVRSSLSVNTPTGSGSAFMTTGATGEALAITNAHVADGTQIADFTNVAGTDSVRGQFLGSLRTDGIDVSVFGLDRTPANTAGFGLQEPQAGDFRGPALGVGFPGETYPGPSLITGEVVGNSRGLGDAAINDPNAPGWNALALDQRDVYLAGASGTGLRSTVGDLVGQVTAGLPSALHADVGLVSNAPAMAEAVEAIVAGQPEHESGDNGGFANLDGNNDGYPDPTPGQGPDDDTFT